MKEIKNLEEIAGYLKVSEGALKRFLSSNKNLLSGPTVDFKRLVSYINSESMSSMRREGKK